MSMFVGETWRQGLSGPGSTK